MAIGLILVTNSNSYCQMVTDTVIVEEDQVEEPPPQEAIPDEEEEDKKQKKYFNTKDNADSFTVSERQLPPGYASGLKKDGDFWYADESFNKKEKEEKTEKTNEEYVPLGQRSWVQTLLWIIIIGAFAAAIMYYLADSNVGLFRRKRTLTDPSATGEEEIPEDIFAINYQKEIDKAAAQGNYRLAIRLMFLRLLRSLSEKNIIQYKQDRTNLDYLMHLHPTKYYKTFFRLTRHFEFAWYGHFDVDNTAYTIIASEFNQFDREV